MNKISYKSLYISIVIPVFNEETNIPVLYHRLNSVLESYRHEIIFVNDGATDSSATIIENLYRKDKSVKLISLSRNFGHQMAITCGLDNTNGDVAIIMDADLQDPPELIPEMLKKWRDGFDVVYTVRRVRIGENRFKLISANLFYQIINILSSTKIPKNVGDFRLISKRVIETLRTTREYQRFLRGMVSWIGFKQIGIEYKREKRYAGQSKYSTTEMSKLGLNALFSFSLLPLRMVTVLGILSATCGVAYLIYALIVTLRGDTVRGWSSLVVLILFLGSVQLISLGIIGEYLGRIYEEGKHRPLYIVDSKLGFTKYKFT